MEINLNIINNNEFTFEYDEEFKNILTLIMKKESTVPNQVLHVELTIIDNNEIAMLNEKHRGKEGPTDVLSFSLIDEINSIKNPEVVLGDIFISFEKIEQQAKEYSHSIKREWCYIFAHSIYHLLGYDHIQKNEELEMNEKVSQIMSKINVLRNNE